MHVTNLKGTVEDSKGIAFEYGVLDSVWETCNKEKFALAFGVSIPISSPLASLWPFFQGTSSFSKRKLGCKSSNLEPLPCY